MATIGQYTIKIAGKELDNWKSFTVPQTLDLNNEEGTIVFPDFEPLKNVNFVNQDIQIFRDGVLCWRGLGLSYKSVLSEQGYRDWNLSVTSNKTYLAREVFRKGSPASLVYAYGGTITSYNALASQSTLIKDVFNDILACQYNTVLTAGKIDAPTTYPHVTTLFARINAMYALQQLIDASLWEVRFNPDNTVDFQQTVGSQTSVFSFVEGMNLVDFQYEYGIDKFVNDPIVCGAGSASGTRNAVNDNQVFAEPTNNVNSLASFGRYSKIYNFSSIYDSNTLTAYANALQNDLQLPLYTLNLLVTVAASGVPFKIGDVVSVTSPSLKLTAEPYRIVGLSRSYDASSGEQITLSVQPNARLVSLAHMRFRQLQYILNSQTMNQQATNNTMNLSPPSVPLSVLGATFIEYNQFGGQVTSSSGTNNQILFNYDITYKIPETGTGNNYQFAVGGTLTTVSGINQIWDALVIDQTTGQILTEAGPGLNVGTISQNVSLNSTNLNGHTITFRVVVMGMYTTALGNAQWSLTETASMNGGSSSIGLVHVGAGLTGTFAGGTAKIRLNASNFTLTTWSLTIWDATTSSTLYTNSSPSPNTDYPYTLAADAMDHDIQFEYQVSGGTPTGTYPWSLELQGTLTLTQPTLPT